jgi:hypothetical protein
MNWLQLARKNWKTSLGGVVAFLVGLPVFVSAVLAWAEHQPVNWRLVCVSVALAAAGAGLVSAKDATTHSTVEETKRASVLAVIAAAKAGTLPEGNPGGPAPE